MRIIRTITLFALVLVLAAPFGGGAWAAPQKLKTSAVFAYTKGLGGPDAALTFGLSAIMSYKADAAATMRVVPETEYDLVQGAISIESLWNSSGAEAVRVAQGLRADALIVMRARVVGGGKVEAEFRVASVSNGKAVFRTLKESGASGDVKAYQVKFASALLEKLIPGGGGAGAAKGMPYTSNAGSLKSFCTGLGFIAQGKTADGLKALEDTAKADPNFRDLNYYLGRYYATQKFDYQKAINYLARITALLPNDAAAHYWLGFTYYLKGSAQAINEFEASCRIKPAQPDAYVYLADLYKGRGDFDRVESYYVKALELTPGNAALWYNLAGIQAQMGRVRPEKIGTALASLKKALDLDCSSFLPIVKTDADFSAARRKPEFIKLVKDYSQKCPK